MLKNNIIVFIYMFLLCELCSAQSSMHVTDTFHIKSDGWWDYILADTASDKLYVSHGTQVNVLNKNTGDSVGVIQGTRGVHGIAIVHDLNKGFTSNGRLNNIYVFNLNSFKVIDSIATGKNPDAIFYDNYSKMIITCNGGSGDISLIDPATNTMMRTIDVKGKPETAVSNNKGKIFINNEDKNEIEVIDIDTKRLIDSWSLAPGEEPSGLSIDRKNNLLFAGCSNKLLMIINAVNGKVIDKLPIGDGCDGTAFDPATNSIYSSNGDGTLTIAKELSADSFKVIANLPTQRSARTLSLDASTHKIYLPAANFIKPLTGEKRSSPVSGTFKILVVK